MVAPVTEYSEEDKREGGREGGDEGSHSDKKSYSQIWCGSIPYQFISYHVIAFYIS